MSVSNGVHSQNDPVDQTEDQKPRKRWQFWVFMALLLMDALGSGLFFSCILPGMTSKQVAVKEYSFANSIVDLLILGVARILVAMIAFAVAYLKGEIQPEYYFNMFHEDGTKKSRDELEEEALEQNFQDWFRRYIVRPAFSCEFFSVITILLGIVKCLVRLDLQIGRYADREPMHPVIWISVMYAAVMAVLELCYVDRICVLLGEWGHADRDLATRPLILRQLSSTLSLPLLADDSLQATDEETATNTEGGNEQGQETDENAPAVSDISGDANYKASWNDLMMLCAPDAPLILVAFIFLLLAAAAQIYIPKYTGAILDKLAETFTGGGDDDGDDATHKSMKDVPGFMSNVRKLIAASVLGGVFSGIRGSIFTVVGGRVNVRLRLRLMDSLLVQDIGFFDTTKTGDITSRLSSDTTLVGDQVTLNVNVFLRSLVQAIGVLIFMFVLSWQLSILAFISVPVITVLSKWYGQFIRNLTKVMQTKLANGNSVSEAAISSMPTVRAFDAAPTELKEFEECMKKYLSLTMKAAVAYSGYATCATSLPQLVTALVVYYGGLLVRNGDLTTGELVSFLLYLTSLSDAFSSIGYIFSSLTQAVGAADKVFELMNRKPKLRLPSTVSNSTNNNGWHGESRLTTRTRQTGLEPEVCRGEIVLENVDMYYPARPQRRVLNRLSLTVPPGKVAALVGQSGGGKSSVISLVQHLYEQSNGKVTIDGIEVHELSPRWLSRHISIVSQEPTLFGRSIKRNIMYGLEGTELEPTDEEIERVAKLANAHSFIETMPRKYDTDVGERGVQLSGGQKQRIAIARALVRKPKILLLDEATSALDAESEAMVQEAIDHMLAAGREDGNSTSMTVLIVAHRLSTIRNADIIFVVQDGKVVEQGNHAELIQNPSGAYTSLIRRQMDVQQKLDDPKLETEIKTLG